MASEYPDPVEEADMRINRGWIEHRWDRRHCDHQWAVGDRKSGHKACMQPDCGVWRWWPVISR
jgi:hypothetical protein